MSINFECHVIIIVNRGEFRHDQYLTVLAKVISALSRQFLKAEHISYSYDIQKGFALLLSLAINNEFQRTKVHPS